MEQATDLRSGKLVAAENAPRGRRYICPRPGCGGRVYLPNVRNQRPHFRHYPGEGTPECDEYYPGLGNGGSAFAPVAEAVEDDPRELGLLLAQIDDRWALGVRLPEIPKEQMGTHSLQDLCDAFVEVSASTDYSVRASALDLRPGVGIARIDIVPSTHPVRAQPSGIWPASIDKRRWQLECKGMEAFGTLFRLRRGEWTRLQAGSGVHAGEALLLVADAHCPPPESITSARCATLAGKLRWTIWDITLPDQSSHTDRAWLARLGHSLIPRPWRIELVTPPRAFGPDGEPIFWIGDTAMLAVQGPADTPQTHATLKYDTNCFSGTLAIPKVGPAYIDLELQHPGISRFAISSDSTAHIEIFVQFRPTKSKCLAALEQPRRLRVWIGETTLEAWQSVAHSVLVNASSPTDVRIELGMDCARTQVIAWERGKQHLISGLDGRSAASLVQDLLLSASRIEIDAGNLGRVTLLPKCVANTALRAAIGQPRLNFYDRMLAARVHSDPQRQQEAWGIAETSPEKEASLIRTRLALRGRITKGEFRE